MKTMKFNEGFTLVEAMTVLAIVAILAVLATPNVSEAVSNSRLRSSSDSLFALIRFARAEAARKGQTLQVGALDGNSWASGAMVWADMDGDAGFDPDEDTEIRRTTVSKNLTIAETNNIKIIPFNGQGYTAAAITLSVCDNRSSETGRQIDILPSGFSAMKAKGDCQ